MTIMEIDGKCMVMAGGDVYSFPARLAEPLQAVIDAAKEVGAGEARARIRAALGVDEAIEDEARAIYANLGPQ